MTMSASVGAPTPDDPPADVTDRRGSDSAAADLLKALANPLRVGIVRELDAGPRCVHELVDALGVTQPLVSQHLRILRQSRLIVGQRRGRETAYALADHHVAHIVLDAINHAEEAP